MSTPVNEAHAQSTGANTTAPQPLLSKQQKTMVNIMYLASLAISLTGVGLIAGTVGLSNADLNSPRNMLMSSLRFPCVLFGMSFLCCSEFASKYFKRMNEMQKEPPPFLMQEINRQVEEKVANLTPNESNSLERRR